MLRITECPRDAMQGIHEFIPTNIKAEYINKLLKVGFDTLDFGSFVSPKAVPQMRDTVDVIKKLDLGSSRTKLLAIVANLRGAEEAVIYPEIDYLGYPFSISETFQKRNANSTIEDSFNRLIEIKDLADQLNKDTQVYLSMAFGNPYNDPYNADIVAYWTEKMSSIGIRYVALADTIGKASPELIKELFSKLVQDFPFIDFTSHFHSRPEGAEAKLQAAFEGGCKSFDTAISGFGGCPFAEDELVGNIATETLVEWADDQDIDSNLDYDALEECIEFSHKVFKYE